MNMLVDKQMLINIELNGIITGIVGPSASGKTYFLKKLCNKVDNNSLYLDDKQLNKYDINFLKNNIVVVLNDNVFNQKFVIDELSYFLRKLNGDLDDVTERIIDIMDYFNIDSYKNKKISDLSLEKRMLIKILSLLIINPSIIAIDGLYSYLNKVDKDLLINYIKENGMSLILTLSDMNDLLICTNVVVMNNMKSIMNSNIQSVLNGNSILPYMGIKLPFLVDLCQNLMIYNLIDKNYEDIGKLVNKLWK